MKLGIMQPYFLPYLGYFDLIDYSDKWVVFDTVQYIRHGWINRNRILHPNSGSLYITVPIKKNRRETKIKDIEVATSIQYGERILNQLQHYRKTAPFFNTTCMLLEDCFATKEKLLSRLNVTILDKVCRFLEIPFNYEYFSEMDLSLITPQEPDEWALNISIALGATEYVNAPGGKTFFEPQKYTSKNIKLTFRQLPPITYSCPGYEFIENLSIIDVLMWNPPEKIRQHLHSHGT